MVPQLSSLWGQLTVSKWAALTSNLDDTSVCPVHDLKEQPHARVCWPYQRSIDRFVWTFFSQERQLASASPADNTTLAAPPLHKWMKICLLFFLLQWTRLHYILNHKSCLAFLHPFVQRPPRSSTGRGPSPQGSIALARQMALAL